MAQVVETQIGGGNIMAQVVVDTQWLNERLNDPRVRVVEVDTSPETFKDAHIPGAIFWNTFTDLLLPDLQMNLDPTAMAQLLARSGITNETTVVAYGSYPGTGAWIFWLLKALGHPHVRVLNGGHQKWLAENRPISKDLAQYAPTQYRVQAIDPSLRISQLEVQAAIGQKERVLLDVRTDREYRGEYFLIKPPEPTERAGHIPGAVHIEHLHTLNQDGTFKSIDQLLELYSSHGVTADKEIIPYCAIGARAGYVWFVLKYLLGYPHVRNYDGSWNQWSRIADAPVEK